MKKFKKGFTLIELLVVMAIIGILASLALVSYSAAQKQARDTMRKSDLAQLRNGLENYAAANDSLYPGTANDTPITNVATLCSGSLVDDYISACVADPVATQTYGINVGLTSYVLWADLESADADFYWCL